MIRTRCHRGLTLIEVVVVIAIIGLLIGITIPAVHRARDAGYRTRCASQLRQIGMAAHDYHAIHGRFPPGSRSSGSQQPYSSWIAQLLPQLERVNLWHQTQQAYAADKHPFHNPPHVALDVVLPILNCPADGRMLMAQTTKHGYPVAFTCYLGVSGDEPKEDSGVLFRESKVNTRDVTDGCSHTIMVGERPPSADFIFGWWYAGTGTDGQGTVDYLLNAVNSNHNPQYGGTGSFSFSPGRVNNQSDTFHFWSLHVGGSHFLFADGSSHFLSYSAAKILPALATRAGGEAAPWPD